MGECEVQLGLIFWDDTQFFTGNKDNLPFNLRAELCSHQTANSHFVQSRVCQPWCSLLCLTCMDLCLSCGTPVHSRRLPDMITLVSPSLCLPRRDSLPPSPLVLSPGCLLPVAPAQPLSSHTGRLWLRQKHVFVLSGCCSQVKSSETGALLANL